MQTIAYYKKRLEGKMHGTTLNSLKDFEGICHEASSKILLDLDLMELKRSVEISTPVYNQVYVYPVPVDLKGVSVIDIKPQINRNLSDNPMSTYDKDFDISKGTGPMSFNVTSDSGTRYVNINATNLPTGITINQANTITGNGTWAVGASASNLTANSVNYLNSTSCLQFDLAAAGATGTVTNSTMSSVDLSNIEDQGSIFVNVYLPTGSDFTSINLDWGSDNANYWSKSVTVTQEGAAFVNGWNLLRFDWTTATQTGAPDSTAVDYLKVTYTYNGTAQTAVKLNGIVARLGAILVMEYYSEYMFQDGTTGGWKNTVSADNDIVLLNTEAENIFLYLITILATQQSLGQDATFDVNFSDTNYLQMIAKYKERYKSEQITPRKQYYTVQNKSYAAMTGRAIYNS